eukprot:4511061-Pyramimonas_sp.AAC.1
MQDAAEVGRVEVTSVHVPVVPAESRALDDHYETESPASNNLQVRALNTPTRPEYPKAATSPRTRERSSPTAAAGLRTS